MTITITTLPSGLRVASDPMPGLRTASVGLWVDAGARYETAAENGISHLLEHMAFKGTARRSARAIAEEIEAVGGHLNAHTSYEQTAYYARVLSQDLPLAVDILADILQGSTFAEEELERERQVVIQEIGQAEDTPDDIIFDLLQEVAYPDQALGRPILGRAEGVAGFARGSLQAYMAHHYRADRMVLAAAGGVDHAGLVALAEEHLGHLAPAGRRERETARYRGGDFREARDLEQLHFTLTFPGLAYDDPDFHALQVYSTLLGGGMSSRLFQEVREKRGLAYSIYSFATSYLDGGLFTIYAGTGEREAAELAPLMAGEVLSVAGGVDEDEVARARAQIKAGLLMSRESSAARCEQMARQMLILGRPQAEEELIRKIDAVDAAAVSRVAGRLLALGKPTAAAIGPIGRLEPYDALAARFA